MYGVTDPKIEQAVSTYVKLLRAARAVLGRLEPLLAANGLTMTQLGVLEALLHGGPLTHRDLGRKVLTSAANMTDVVDKLELRGLVRRVRCPEDRRLVHVDLTDSGRCLIERLFPAHACDIAQAMSGLDSAGLVQLGDLLRALGMAAAEPPLAMSCPATHLDA
jgi:MarR family 2-MHQ and catechol resistance regulon transcriptional repressor